MSSWVSNAPPGAVDDDRATTPLDIPQARLDKQVNNAKGYSILDISKIGDTNRS